MTLNRDQNGTEGMVLRPRNRSRLAANVLAPSTTHSTGASPSPLQLQARRRPRAANLLDNVRTIDASPTPQAQAAVREWLQEWYETRGGGQLIGLFGHCYLGAPYVDHAIGFDGVILEHYQAQQEVPGIYTAARPLAVSEAYAYIEIYADGHVVPIRPDGSPVI
ncbi:hypothetical protein JOD52_002899 [Brachybacterium muris]|uniref:hypothetical protein n=1 Tax=Brachybacterium muris TaxID=219301 RepID=UPI0019588D0B|nr:hypothetical protein [Brachybacterium muris]MBM7502059.1 hypothetical protein [Brachybacterium muris]